MNQHARDALLKKVETMKILPSPVGIVSRTIAAMQQPECSFNTLFDVVKDDIAITSKFLSIANSAYFSRGQTIDSLMRAMVAIGFKSIKEFLTCMIFYDGILKNMKLGRADAKLLWGHSCYVAYAARILAEEEKTVDPERAFTFALLHDIGKVIFCLLVGRTYRVSMKQRADYQKICSWEKECFGIDHQEMGGVLAMKWELPGELVGLIGRHHTTEAGEEVIDLVGVSNEFAYSQGNRYARNDREAFLMGKQAKIEDEIQKVNDMLQ